MVLDAPYTVSGLKGIEMYFFSPFLSILGGKCGKKQQELKSLHHLIPINMYNKPLRHRCWITQLMS